MKTDSEFYKQLFLLCVLAALVLINIIPIAAADLEQSIVDRGLSFFDAVGTIIGVRNGISILLLNMIVRGFRARKLRQPDEIRQLLKRQAIFFGAGTILLTSDISAILIWTPGDVIVFVQALVAAPFITYWGAIGLYELVRTLLIIKITNVREKGGDPKTWKKIFFMVDPAPIKTKNNKKEIIEEIEPDEDFTRMSDTIFGRHKYVAPPPPDNDFPKTEIFDREDITDER
jgi:hypothetical protein